jgi:hypothetical protein
MLRRLIRSDSGSDSVSDVRIGSHERTDERTYVAGTYGCLSGSFAERGRAYRKEEIRALPTTAHAAAARQLLATERTTP